MSVTRPLWLIGAAPLIPLLIGSAVNIWYNLTQIDPLLTDSQRERFIVITMIFNLAVYPALLVVWIAILASLCEPLRRRARGQPVDTLSLERARRRTINLPWWSMVLGGAGWLLCIPVFILGLSADPEPLDLRLYAHLPISFLISGLIAVTHAFFIIELLSQRLLYPVFFLDGHPWATSGAFALSLRARGLLWAVSAGVCPIASLLLLTIVPRVSDTPTFTVAVGILGMAFGLTTAWLVGRLVTEPVHALRHAAQAVAGGDLSVRLSQLRADEFGPLIDDFNGMVAGLREKTRIEENFGRHVGERIARQILASDRGLGGVEEETTVLFLDIRNFTARSAASSAARIVAILNLFLAEMVEVVEQRHDGIVNKFLGDGLMALFGRWTGCEDHAGAALAAGAEMLVRLQTINAKLAVDGEAPLGIGIGLHSGLAVVGSIGSPRRMEYTAIGDTVNVASRVEGLTKTLGEPLLFTAATLAALRTKVPVLAYPPQPVKGQVEPVAVYGLRAEPERSMDSSSSGR